MESTPPPASTDGRASMKAQLDKALFTPVRAFRLSYLPLIMIYFASGALGLTAIAESFWIRKSLSLSAADLAALAAWLTLPWTIKMVFGEMVDTMPILGSQRRAYVYIGAGLMAAGALLLTLAAAGKLPQISNDLAYKVSSVLITVGVVIQDVVADAMTVEVVPRCHDDGTPRPAEDINRELGMVQVLGRLAVTAGGFIVAGLGGWLAGVVSYASVFAIGIAIPALSVVGAVLVPCAAAPARPTDWRILGGGIAFGAFAVVMALTDLAYAQEVVFVVSLAVVIAMIGRVIGHLDADTRKIILFAGIIIFVYRATPNVGEGFTWYTMDVLGFDETFRGWLAQLGAALTLIVAWLFSDAITRQPVARVLLWLTIVTTVLELPGLGLTMGLHEWTEKWIGLGARSIAVIDAAATSPFYQLSLIPLFTLCAIYAPPGWAASWFALTASLMNLSLVASSLISKYLNTAFVVERGSYGQLSMLLAVVLMIGLVMPVAAILVFGRRLK